MQRRPSQVALNLGYSPPGSPTRTSSEYEEVNYPENNYASQQPHWSSQQEEELPLHYMNEETAARRRVRAGGAAGNGMDDLKPEISYGDEGKDVYNKMRPMKGPTLGGRPQRPAPPPATSLVSATRELAAVNWRY